MDARVVHAGQLSLVAGGRNRTVSHVSGRTCFAGWEVRYLHREAHMSGRD